MSLRLAQKYNKPVVAFCGKCEDKETLLEAGFEDVRFVLIIQMLLLEKGPQYLERSETLFGGKECIRLQKMNYY